MKLLAIDTSTERASFALVIDNHYFTLEECVQKQHAQVILPLIQSLLKEADITLQQLEGIVFGQGPGSFTGLRIACSVAKGLAYAHDLPLFPVSTLKAIANTVFAACSVPKEACVLSVIDARMNQLYWACIENGEVNFSENVSHAEDIQVPCHKPIILAGVGFEAYKSQLPLLIKENCIMEQQIYPCAKSMLNLVISGNIKPISIEKALPVYIRNQVVNQRSKE